MNIFHRCRFTNASLRDAIKLCEDRAKALSVCGPINNWNTSLVTDMSALFKEQFAFNDDISNWNVSHVTDMSRMFESATLFNHSLENWDVVNVQNMANMFRNASSFDQLIDRWDVSNVAIFTGIIDGASRFNVQTLRSWKISDGYIIGLLASICTNGSLRDAVKAAMKL
jgi:surface protein